MNSKRLKENGAMAVRNGVKDLVGGNFATTSRTRKRLITFPCFLFLQTKRKKANRRSSRTANAIKINSGPASHQSGTFWHLFVSGLLTSLQGRVAIYPWHKYLQINFAYNSSYLYQLWASFVSLFVARGRRGGRGYGFLRILSPKNRET